MKKQIKLDPAVFIAAARMIDSHEKDFACNALVSACSWPDLLSEYEHVFRLFNPGHRYPTQPWWGDWDTCLTTENRKARTLALLFCAAMVS